MAAKPHFGIIGMGLGGCLVAWHLLQRGCSFKAWDLTMPGAASNVGPGLLTPLIGRKFEPIKMGAELWPAANLTYAAIENQTRQLFRQEMPVVRFFTDPDQPTLLQANLQKNPEWSHWVEKVTTPGELGNHWNDKYGAVVMKEGGWLDMLSLCRAIKSMLAEQNRMLEPSQITLAEAYDEVDTVIDCTGWRTSTSEQWKFIEHNPARGEIIIVRFEQPVLLPAVWHFGHWLQPLENGLWRMGATYGWGGFESGPTLSGRSTLELSLRRWLKVSFKTVDCVVGVRPAIRDYRPVVGRHPTQPNLAICSGFGSHGSLYAPFCAKSLVDHLLEGTPLTPDIDCSRFRL